MANEFDESAHPLDGCDPADCYQTMMSERTELVKARREAEDNLVKSIIQISATLIVLVSGFLVQTNVAVSDSTLRGIVFVLALLSAAVVFGLTEQLASSKAYTAQQKLVEDYYTKRISIFSEPKANKLVRFSQVCAFISFTLALALTSVIGYKQSKEKNHVGQSSPSPSSSAAAAAPSPSSSAAAAAPSAAAPSAAPASAASAASASADQSRRGQVERIGDKIGGADNATSATKKVKG